MKPKCKNPRKFMNPLLSKKGNVSAAKFEEFKINFEKYKTDIDHQHKNNQSEPNIVTNALKPFIDSIGYITNSHSQKGQGGIDLAILKDDCPAVIFEVKKNKSKDMITSEWLNEKAFHEAILYFLRERYKGNQALFHIIISDFYNWYVFDAKDFDRLFWKNSSIKKIYDGHIDPSLLSDKTSDFYTTLKKAINAIAESSSDERLDCAYFDVKAKNTEKDLIGIYKLLSKDSLLKEFNPNDANSLNKDFYNEFLYIFGLEEKKKNGKKVIDKTKDKQTGSFYESIDLAPF